jgi:hypothetical protein
MVRTPPPYRDTRQCRFPLQQESEEGEQDVKRWRELGVGRYVNMAPRNNVKLSRTPFFMLPA